MGHKRPRTKAMKKKRIQHKLDKAQRRKGLPTIPAKVKP
jgi:hypothetical protein